MKNILTLQTSSMFFVGSVNLYKGLPIEVDSDEMTDREVVMVNNFIENGSIVASEGLLKKQVEVKAPELEVVDTPVQEVVESPAVIDVQETVDTPELVVEEVKKAVTSRKTQTKKPTPKKED